MKITFEELLSRKEWLHTELLHSLTGDVINKASEDQFYEVKLLVNGIELEPTFFNNLVNGIEKYVDKEANSLLEAKLEKCEFSVERLKEYIYEASYKIREEFELKDINEE